VRVVGRMEESGREWMRECEKEWSAEWESVRQSGSLWSYGVRVEFMELW